MLDFPNDFCPLTPTDRQREFLSLDCLEAFFGGAAGGGKSVALLMGALQYVDVPGYAALILRKDTQRLSLAGGLIPRSHEWLTGKEGVKWNAARRCWTFATAGAPASITFGYLSNSSDKYRYMSSEFQYIAFDELTELQEDDYLFLFSRLRKAKSLDVPLRIRSASNPGGLGHLWVKQRFVGQWTPDGELPAGMTAAGGAFYLHEKRAFVPSLIADNQHLDGEEYLASLMYLQPVTRERLARGDWSVQEKGVFEEKWLRYFTLAPEQLDLLNRDGSILRSIPLSAFRSFITVDPAGTSADREQDARRGSHSFSVVQVWQQPRARELSHFLILREQRREQIEIVKLERMIRSAQTTWKTEQIWIEDCALGHALVSNLRNGTPPLPAEVVPTKNKDKELRAAPLANKMEQGEVFLPQDRCEWRPTFEAEFLAWNGRPGERSDQIDAAAYAAIIAERQQPAVFVMQHIVEGS